MKIALCLLTYNEITGCRHDVPRIDRSRFDEIYAVDGGSQDGTVEYLTGQNIPVYLQPKPGLNAAHVHAVEKCRSEAIIFFHPKGTIPTEDTLRLRKFFDEGYDLIIASRNIKGARNEEDERLLRPRKWFVGFLALWAALLFRRSGPVIWDVLHGFRGFTLKAFRDIRLPEEGRTVDLASVIRGYRHPLKMIEFPTTERPRLHGKSHFKPLPVGWELLQFLFQEAIRKD